MAVIFAERTPTSFEIERFRLIFSTYQDGSGMLALKPNDPQWMTTNHAKSLPGWRDFERTVALAFNGTTTESKWIYDVLLSNSKRIEIHYGISCKMRGELRKASRKNGRISIELSNAMGEFWDTIKTETGLNEDNYTMNPSAIGQTLINLVEEWHNRVDIQNQGTIDTAKSFILNLQWDRRSGNYQLFQFPTALPDPKNIHWSIKNRRLIGEDQMGTIFEWYGHSGGQLKYYPLVQHALWSSNQFQLEPLPPNLKEIMLDKVERYFSDQWQDAHA